MNIFAVTYCIPPIFAPATIRLVKWFKGLTEAGHHLTVLAIDPTSFGGSIDDSLVSLMPVEGISCRQVWSSEKSLLYRLMQKQENVFFRLIQPGGMGWFRAALKSIATINFREYDLLFTCSSPHSCHLIGRKIKQATKMPWIAYFSDPWVDNPLIVPRSRRIYEYNRDLEAKVVEEADRLVFTTSETIDLVMAKYGGRYLDKCRILPHCYVPEWYELSKARLPAAGSRVRLLHAGSFYADRSAIPLLKAIQSVSDYGRRPMNFEVYLYGGIDKTSADHIGENGMGGIIHSCRVAPFLDSLALMRQADYLLLVDAPLKSHDESVFLPSKLIEYLGSGRPVVGVTPLRGASARVLRETGNLVCDIEDVAATQRTLEKINSGNLDINTKSRAVQKYHYRTVVGILEQTFRELL